MPKGATGGPDENVVVEGKRMLSFSFLLIGLYLLVVDYIAMYGDDTA